MTLKPPTIRTAKLTDDEVVSLRARKARGETISTKAEADRFACGVETIRKILRGDTFRHLLVEHGASVPPIGPSEAEMAASLAAFLGQVKAAGGDNPDDDIQALLGGSTTGELP